MGGWEIETNPNTPFLDFFPQNWRKIKFVRSNRQLVLVVYTKSYMKIKSEKNKNYNKYNTISKKSNLPV